MCVCARVQILLIATFPSPMIRVFLLLVQDRVGNTFTKGHFSFAFQQKGGEIRVPPVSAVSKLSSPQNNARGVVWAIGWPTILGRHILLPSRSMWK